MTRRKGGPSTLSITGDSDFIADLHASISEEKPLDSVENIFFRGGATARPAAMTNIIIQLDELDEILDGGGEEITLRLTNGAEISGAKLVEKRLADCGLVTLVHPYEGAVNLYRTSRHASDKQRLMAGAENPTCPWAECNYPADKCQIHHLRAWKHGGETNMAKSQCGVSVPQRRQRRRPERPAGARPVSAAAGPNSLGPAVGQFKLKTLPSFFGRTLPRSHGFPAQCESVKHF